MTSAIGPKEITLYQPMMANAVMTFVNSPYKLMGIYMGFLILGAIL